MIGVDAILGDAQLQERLATSAISKAHEWARLESPCRDPGGRTFLKGWGRDYRGPSGTETPEQVAERGKFDVALVVALSDAGLRRSEAAADLGRRAALGRRQRRRHRGPLQDRRRSPGHRSSHHPPAMEALNAIRPAGVDGSEKVFGWSESQIARRVKAIAKAAGLADWEFFIGHSGRVGMARRMAQNGAPIHEIERQGRWKQGAGMVGRYTRGERPQGRR